MKSYTFHIDLRYQNIWKRQVFENTRTFIISKNNFWQKIILWKVNAISEFKYRDVLPNHNNGNVGSSSFEQWTKIHLHGIGMRSLIKFIIKEDFYVIKRINMVFSVKTVEHSLQGVEIRDAYTNTIYI